MTSRCAIIATVQINTGRRGLWVLWRLLEVVEGDWKEIWSQGVSGSEPKHSASIYVKALSAAHDPGSEGLLGMPEGECPGTSAGYRELRRHRKCPGWELTPMRGSEPLRGFWGGSGTGRVAPSAEAWAQSHSGGKSDMQSNYRVPQLLGTVCFRSLRGTLLTCMHLSWPSTMQKPSLIGCNWKCFSLPHGEKALRRRPSTARNRQTKKVQEEYGNHQEAPGGRSWESWALKALVSQLGFGLCQTATWWPGVSSLREGEGILCGIQA